MGCEPSELEQPVAARPGPREPEPDAVATEMPGGAGWSAEIDELETAAQRAVATPG